MKPETTERLRMIESLLDGIDTEDRAEAARSIGVYITAAKFEAPPKFKIPPEFPMPKAPEPTPAPPRGP